MKKAVAFGAMALIVLVNMAPVNASAATTNIDVKYACSQSLNLSELQNSITIKNCTAGKNYVIKSCLNSSSTSNSSTSNSSTSNSSTSNSSTSNSSTSSYAEQVVQLVNAERAKQGLTALKIDKNVEKAATIRAKEIQTSFSHTRPNGSSFATALKESGVSYQGAGENIAWGQKTPQEVVAAWMNSPGHRANILNKQYKYIGVGNLQNSSGTQYWVQLFTY